MRLVVAVSLVSMSLAAQGWVDRTAASPVAAPSPRRNAAMCWDAARNYMLLQGGESSALGELQDTWTWNGAAWTQLNPVLGPGAGGGGPYGLERRAITFHPPTNEVVLVYLGFTFTWNGVNWTARSTATIPSNGFGLPCFLSMARDTSRGETVLFVSGRWTGQGANVVPTAETYVWDGAGWSQRVTATPPGPSGWTSMAFDPIAGRLVLEVVASTLTTYWEWNGSNWLQRFYPSAPTQGGAMASDAVSQRIVMLDGIVDASPNHTWTFANGAMLRRGTPVAPAIRTDAAIAFDPVRGKTLLFGGSNGLELGDTWEFTPGADASYSIFGTGCAGARGVPTLAAQSTSLPRVGDPFSVQIGNLPFQGQVFLFLGFSNTVFGPTPLPFSLAGLGAPNCTLLCSGDDTYLLPNLLGTSVWTVTIPNLPGAVFFNQAFAFDPSANAFGIVASNAAQGVVGL